MTDDEDYVRTIYPQQGLMLIKPFCTLNFIRRQGQESGGWPSLRISLLVASQHRIILVSCIALPHNYGHDEIAGVSDEEVIYTYFPVAVHQSNCQSYFNRQKNKKDGSWQQQQQQQNSQY